MMYRGLTVDIIDAF